MAHRAMGQTEAGTQGVKLGHRGRRRTPGRYKQGTSRHSGHRWAQSQRCKVRALHPCPSWGVCFCRPARSKGSSGRRGFSVCGRVRAGSQEGQAPAPAAGVVTGDLQEPESDKRPGSASTTYPSPACSLSETAHSLTLTYTHSHSHRTEKPARRAGHFPSCLLCGCVGVWAYVFVFSYLRIEPTMIKM